jgi:hypothetical protein
MRADKLLIFPVVLLLSACGPFAVRVEPLATTPPTFTPESPTPTVIVTPSPTEPASATSTIQISTSTLAAPTATALQVPATTAVSNPTTASEQNVQIFLIALEDNGQSGMAVGCGDSAIPINVTIPRTQGVLRAALEKLLSARQQFYGESGYYNALYQSDLQVAGVTIEQGKATIRLTGTVMLGGACDAPRVEAQLEQTALQFSTVSEVAIFIDDRPLEDVLSSR